MNDWPPDDQPTDSDTEVVLLCPYCNEPNSISLDPSGGRYQEYVEDCQVCCRPWQVSVSYDEGGRAQVDLEESG